MPFFLLAFGLPIFVVAGFVILIARKKRQGLKVAVLMFGAAFATGAWAILQSRSSTAGIGFLFLPGMASLSGLLAWVHQRLMGNPDKRLRLAAWFCLVASIAVVGLNVTGAIKTRKNNKQRDQLNADYEKQIEKNRHDLKVLLANNRGHEQEVLRQEIEAHSRDSAFLIAALESPFVPGDLLEKLSRFHGDNELNVVLAVTRNPKTPPAVLNEIYRDAQYPFYFARDLAQNKNTPPDLLRELYAQPHEAGDLSWLLARNPSAPKDLLLNLAASQDGAVLRGVLENPALDCEVLQKTRISAAKAKGMGDQATDALIKSQESRLCSK